MLLLPFNLLVGMIFWNYFLCVITDPGQVPASWRPDTQSTDGYEVKKLTGGPRFCRSCEEYKPPRAHHCRQCKRCVLRMDHHCPWVNNCVGHFNYGHFIRFLFYVDVACSYHMAMVTRRVLYTTDARYWDEPSGTELVFIILNYVTCIPVLLAVGAFSTYQFFAMARNTTTIEGWEKDKAAVLVRRGKIQEVKFPYNLSRRRNIESVLGPNPLLWCWPAITPGTGLKYELAENGDTGTPWPPHSPGAVYEDPDHNFVLPSTPWTYENGSVNPNLEPSNTRLRVTSASRRRQPTAASSVPPYHPDYHSGGELSSSSDSDAEYRPIVRRGSEGYEVRPIDREAVLRLYMEGDERQKRYQTYVPEPDSEDSEERSSPVGHSDRMET